MALPRLISTRFSGMLSSSFQRTHSFGKSGTFSVNSRWFQNAEECLVSREGGSYVMQEGRQQRMSKLCACLSTPFMAVRMPQATPLPPGSHHGEKACREGGRRMALHWTVLKCLRRGRKPRGGQALHPVTGGRDMHKAHPFLVL